MNPNHSQVLVAQPQADMRAAQPLGHHGPYIQQYPRPQHHPVLSSLNTSLAKTKSHHYHPYHSGFDKSYRQTPPTPLSPSSLCFSTPEATSPAPLAALVDAAVDEHEHMQTRASASMPPSAQMSAEAPAKQPAQEKVPRKRGSRGPRSTLSPEEREKKRKIAHSKIEKRRRVRTNDVIADLERLIPVERKPSKKLNKAEVLEATLSFMEELLGLSDAPLSDAEHDEDKAEDTKSSMNINFLLA
ncbi:hypothetical protein LPJ53_003918 [Coemansia erecta]|uniref:BHLH domain-containing protein n=1 Tax=Coemansia erecta TaxID=147472 RepID=A0A9W7XVC5_9FUNG|nr:hypothetical protein LPJ53_003918 [Coemansia erecta]